MELVQAPLELAEPPVGALRERVDELEHGRVEAPLVERKGFDVPADELAEDTFGGHEQEPARPTPRSRAVEKRALGADRPKTLRLVAPQREAVVGIFGQVGVPALDLRLKARANRLEVRLLGDRGKFRHDAILGCASCRTQPAGLSSFSRRSKSARR